MNTSNFLHVYKDGDNAFPLYTSLDDIGNPTSYLQVSVKPYQKATYAIYTFKLSVIKYTITTSSCGCGGNTITSSVYSTATISSITCNGKTVSYLPFNVSIGGAQIKLGKTSVKFTTTSSSMNVYVNGVSSTVYPNGYCGAYATVNGVVKTNTQATQISYTSQLDSSITQYQQLVNSSATGSLAVVNSQGQTKYTTKKIYTTCKSGCNNGNQTCNVCDINVSCDGCYGCNSCNGFCNGGDGCNLYYANTLSSGTTKKQQEGTTNTGEVQEIDVTETGYTYEYAVTTGLTQAEIDAQTQAGTYTSEGEDGNTYTWSTDTNWQYTGTDQNGNDVYGTSNGTPTCSY